MEAEAARLTMTKRRDIMERTTIRREQIQDQELQKIAEKEGLRKLKKWRENLRSAINGHVADARRGAPGDKT